jgi:hypothetical protein
MFREIQQLQRRIVMDQRLNVSKFIIPAVLFLLVSSFVIGCGSDADMETQISGKWKLPQNNGIVDIKLDKDPKTVVVDGHSYAAVVENVDKGAYLTKVKVDVAPGKSEVWILRQVWDDNGSTFKLAFEHDGKTDTLVPVNQS